ncbi:hypothetical protein RJ640_006680 [Escallonia rubra]|uniref:RNase H type-1 domain-containing protein n=1 Tax=Escallonia rubra TaxID=112253 RepID=A0AA88RAV8_9ASTE|nr:hypothetical protein RJ640_006680 [Escallonia rubra]
MESGNLLRKLKGRDCLPWLCGGDFNEILRQDEKEGRTPKVNWQMRNFHEALDDCGLADLEYSGFKFTWCNNHTQPATVRERLDRFCATAEWMNAFPNAKVRHLNTIASDHSPILLYLKDDCLKASQKAKKKFRFESMWIRKEQCTEIIKSAWEKTEEGCPFKKIVSKIKDCRVGLLRWNRTTIGNVQARIRATLDKIATIKMNPITEESKQCERELIMELDELRNMEEDFWKQRSHENWASEGDRNTRFFHNKASARKKRSNITNIRGANGEWCQDGQERERAIVSYFEDLFTTANPSEQALQEAMFEDTYCSNNVLSWWQEVNSRLKIHEMKLFVVVCWFLWKNRNMTIFHGAQMDALELYSEASHYLDYFRNAQENIRTNPHPNTNKVVWSPPCGNWVKINFDAAIFRKERNMGCGIIVRDSKGIVLAALSKKIYGVTDPEHAEAIAAGEAARFGYDCGFNFVQMEGDAKLIINALNSSEENLSAIGGIIDDVKRIAHCFDSCTFQHIKRSGNEAAHGLAKFAYSLTEALVWMGDEERDTIKGWAASKAQATSEAQANQGFKSTWKLEKAEDEDSIYR